MKQFRLSMFMYAALIFIMLILFSGPVYATLITNGDFETGDLYGWNPLLTDDVTVTTSSGSQVAFFNDKGDANSRAQLSQTFDIPNILSTPGITVDFDINLRTPVDPSLSYFTGSIGLKTTSGWKYEEIFRTYDLGELHVTAELLFDSYDLVDNSSKIYFTLFEKVGDNSRAYLDNVVVNANPVPEPTTMLLLSAGLAGLSGFRRKFRK